MNAIKPLPTQETKREIAQTQAIEKSCKELFSSVFRPQFRKLSVTVGENGEATLQGEVKTFHERQVALSLAHHTAGVIAVVDEIFVTE